MSENRTRLIRVRVSEEEAGRGGWIEKKLVGKGHVPACRGGVTVLRFLEMYQVTICYAGECP